MTGLELPGKNWRVIRKINRTCSATGGNYSDGYVVEHKDLTQAFLKAFDFSEARNAPDQALAVQAMINAYVHERELLKKCGAKGLDRVVRAIDSGKIDMPHVPGGMIFYLIFERASADARELMDTMRHLDLCWRFRTLHDITVGLYQLHTTKIAHQDVKPSNILDFPGGSKLADLGRACSTELPAPHADEAIPGDPSYAPPELLYNSINSDWVVRRFGCDLYLLGSMVVYLFTNQAMTHLLVSALPENLRPAIWGDSFDAALPFLREAFQRALEVFAAHVGDAVVRDQLVPVVQQLCDPDPSLRGYPPNRSLYRDRYSLHQYMTKFDRLAYEARVGRL